jgi:hypothetical protein
MPVTVKTLNCPLNFDLSAQAMDDLAPFMDVLLCPSQVPMLTLEISAGSLDGLLDAIKGVAGRLDDPDRIAAIRVDEDACCAELDVAARPVGPLRLH